MLVTIEVCAVQYSGLEVAVRSIGWIVSWLRIGYNYSGHYGWGLGSNESEEGEGGKTQKCRHGRAATYAG